MKRMNEINESTSNSLPRKLSKEKKNLTFKKIKVKI